MTSEALRYLTAMRVPKTVRPRSFGLWHIARHRVIFPQHAEEFRLRVGWDDFTALHRLTERTLHHHFPEVVMEDSKPELVKHLPICIAAFGRVLVTGLGLGCVVRGLLANPRVSRVDVVEIDPGIIQHIGPECSGNDRVHIRHGNALTIKWPTLTGFNWAWHDIWSEDESLPRLHAQLYARYFPMVEQKQGAWGMPKWFTRRAPGWVLGSRKRMAA